MTWHHANAGIPLLCFADCSDDCTSSHHAFETGNRGVNRSHPRRLIGLPFHPGECEMFCRETSVCRIGLLRLRCARERVGRHVLPGRSAQSVPWQHAHERVARVQEGQHCSPWSSCLPRKSPRAIPLGKHAGHRGRVEERMRMVTACFARAPSRCMNDTYVHLLLKFHEVRLVSNTRYSNLVDDDAMSVGSAS